jgi:signal transduction histidine kinase
MRATAQLDVPPSGRVGQVQPHPDSAWEALIPAACFTQALDGSFIWLNSEIENVTGLSGAQWQDEATDFWSCVHEADFEGVRAHWDRCLESPQIIHTHRFRLRQPFTQVISSVSERRQAVRGSNGELLFQGTWINVTPESAAQERLPASSWQRSLASLTPGVAHDLNNHFASILALSDSFVRKTPPDHPLHQGSKTIKDSVQQAARLVQQLVAMHLSKLGEFRYHDLNELTRETVEFLRHATSRRFEFKSELAPGSLPIYADSQVFKRCLIAIVKNAVEAVPMPAPGKITFSTAPEASIPVDLRPRSGPRAKPYVTLAIHNTGPAIPDHESRQLFTSWFSSKPPAEGAGLSLWWARQSLEAQGGTITLDPGHGQGTTFRLWFPLSDFTEAEPPHGAIAPPRILVVGSEPGLEEAAAGLRLAGCRVTATSRHALELINTTDQPYDALVVLSEVEESEVRSLVQTVRSRRWKTRVARELPADPGAVPWQSRPDLTIPHPLHQPEHCAKLRAALTTPL